MTTICYKFTASYGSAKSFKTVKIQQSYWWKFTAKFLWITVCSWTLKFHKVVR